MHPFGNREMPLNSFMRWRHKMTWNTVKNDKPKDKSFRSAKISNCWCLQLAMCGLVDWLLENALLPGLHPSLLSSKCCSWGSPPFLPLPFDFPFPLTGQQTIRKHLCLGISSRNTTSWVSCCNWDPGICTYKGSNTICSLRSKAQSFENVWKNPAGKE